MKDAQKQTIGRTDKIDFPEWGLFDIDAKIDSGAYTSSIHCEDIEAFYVNDEHQVRFTVQGAGKIRAAMQGICKQAGKELIWANGIPLCCQDCYYAFR